MEIDIFTMASKLLERHILEIFTSKTFLGELVSIKPSLSRMQLQLLILTFID